MPQYDYRDGGAIGDGLVEKFITRVGAHLEPGGVAQLLGNWETRGGERGLDRVRGWVAASSIPLDAWVIERDVQHPLEYARLWVRDGGTVPGTPEYARLVTAWLDDFDARGVEQIGFGYVLLRRPSTAVPTLSRYETLTAAAAPALGEHLAAALAAHDRLDALSSAELAASTLRVAADVTEVRHHRPGSDAPAVIELRQGGALRRVTEVDAALAAIVGACDGELTLGAIVAAVAELLELDATALRHRVDEQVRELVFTGVLGLPDV